MGEHIVRVLACVVLASTLVLTQGFLAGAPLLPSNDGLAVALTRAEKKEKIAKEAVQKAQKAAEEAAQAAEKALAKAEEAAQTAEEAAQTAEEAAEEAAQAAEEAARAAGEAAAHDQP